MAEHKPLVFNNKEDLEVFFSKHLGISNIKLNFDEKEEAKPEPVPAQNEEAKPEPAPAQGEETEPELDDKLPKVVQVRMFFANDEHEEPEEEPKEKPKEKEPKEENNPKKAKEVKPKEEKAKEKPKMPLGKYSPHVSTVYLDYKGNRTSFVKVCRDILEKREANNAVFDRIIELYKSVPQINSKEHNFNVINMNRNLYNSLLDNIEQMYIYLEFEHQVTYLQVSAQEALYSINAMNQGVLAFGMMTGHLKHGDVFTEFKSSKHIGDNKTKRMLVSSS